jgi:heat-inducible transcriptional repressor
MNETLSDRERKVLEAIVQSYVESAEPVGSRTIARRFGLGVSAATIRNAMSDLEEKGYLFHPHTSAGRVPTDRAYRLYVDSLMGSPRVTREEREALRDLATEASAVTAVLRRAAEVLGVLTQELGVAVAPSFGDVVLERLELVSVAADRLLLVLTLRTGAVRTIYVQVSGSLNPEAVVGITLVLNERLGGLTLREIRLTIGDRLRDAGTTAGEHQLLDIFLATAERIFDVPAEPGGDMMLGQTSVLATQPEFQTGEQMRQLLTLTEQRDVLRRVLGQRDQTRSLTITIGTEHESRELANLTLVTSPYRAGQLTGVIGVLGPTRMPYDKVVALVEHTSRMVSDLLR